MDPDAALDIALDLDRPLHERQDALHGLRRWIESGGFLPAAWLSLSRDEALAHCKALA